MAQAAISATTQALMIASGAPCVVRDIRVVSSRRVAVQGSFRIELKVASYSLQVDVPGSGTPNESAGQEALTSGQEPVVTK
jgi:hypothetical protein